MRKMGFNERWIGLIMVCVKTVTYSIMVNGEPQGLIHPLEEFARETHYLISSSFFARKVSIVSFNMQQVWAR